MQRNTTLENAMMLLEIQPEQLLCIPDEDKRIEQLHYFRLKHECDLVRAKLNGFISADNCEILLNNLEPAYLEILSSDLMQQKLDNFSKFSVGISEMEIRTTAQNNMAASVINVREKDQGVEPGHESVQHRDLFAHIYEKFQNNEERYAFYEKHGGDTKAMYDELQNELPVYLFKLVYNQLTANDEIIPELKNLRKSGRIKNLFDIAIVGSIFGNVALKFYKNAKTVGIDEKNIEAVLEVLANDIARAFGMTVQKQCLYPDTINKLMQLQLKGKWVQGATTLGPVAGGKKNDNYRVRKLLIPNNGIEFISDDSIRDLGEVWATMAIIADPDGIGGRGQNKLLLDGEFVGIDWGHAFQKCLQLQKLLADDFTLNSYDEFVNYSIFDDVPRSAKVKGLIKVAVAAGKRISDAVLTSYGEEFCRKIKALAPEPGKPARDEQVFSDYISKFTEYAAQYTPNLLSASTLNTLENDKNRQNCERIVKAVTETFKKETASRDFLLHKFQAYLQLESQAVDLLSHLEAVMAGQQCTSLRSSNGKVILNHIRITKKNVKNWDINVAADGRHTLSANFNSPSEARQALSFLNAWVKKHPFNNASSFKVEVNKDKRECLQIVFSKEHLNTICACFNEDTIKAEYMRDDFQIYQKCMREKNLIARSNSFGASPSIAIDPANPNHYLLTLSPLRKDENIDENLLAIISVTFNVIKTNDGIQLRFSKDELPTVAATLERLPDQLAQQKKLAEIIERIGAFNISCKNDPSIRLDNIVKVKFDAKNDNSGYIFSINTGHVLCNLLCKTLAAYKNANDLYQFKFEQLDELLDMLYKTYHDYKNNRVRQTTAGMQANNSSLPTGTFFAPAAAPAATTLSVAVHARLNSATLTEKLTPQQQIALQTAWELTLQYRQEELHAKLSAMQLRISDLQERPSADDQLKLTEITTALDRLNRVQAYFSQIILSPANANPAGSVATKSRP